MPSSATRPISTHGTSHFSKIARTTHCVCITLPCSALIGPVLTPASTRNSLRTSTLYSARPRRPRPPHHHPPNSPTPFTQNLLPHLPPPPPPISYFSFPVFNLK